MIRRPPRSTRTTHSFPTRRSSDLRLPDLIDRAGRGEQAVDTDMPLASKFGTLPSRPRQARPSAFLTIMEGCDKFCTYCVVRSEEHTSELQSLMRISYAVFCLKKKIILHHKQQLPL